jgi:ferredoxin/flavodoxin---NADP+ reductase
LMREWRNANLGGDGTGSTSSGNGHGTRPPLGAAHVIGPIPMMRAAAELTREWGVTTFASLNPIMVDGTGMCGGCRVSVEGKARFACVDGPEFDAHQVDFDELIRRNRAYIEHERRSRERHQCLIGLDQ